MLEKKYNHLDVEKGKYDYWLKNNLFQSGDLNKTPYCIVLPPPNVTGKLHVGHAWDGSLQDIISRYKRMQGFDVLWLPGMDHAGIATQAKVDKRLKDAGINPRQISRKEWLDHAYNWKEEYANNIRDQWAKLGFSLDYSKERFTLDDKLNEMVNYTFIELYNKGLIYRGERIINWDPVAKTAISNEEVIYKDIEGAFYHIKYYLEDKINYLEIATTRPETLLGDTAVIVNKTDERYNHLIGKNVIVPIVNRVVPIIGDNYADKDVGTGVVKITPAHDPNDFEVGTRHSLDKIIVMNEDATMNENAGSYKGMDRFACRMEIVKDLKRANLLVKTEKMIHSAPHSERSNAVIEPFLSKQWFVKMRPLADKVLINQKDSNNKVNFVPERFEKIMNHWMEITYDWCISRQLWWGHRIPAWYKNDEIHVGTTPPDNTWVQDDDVLDTWFSSALWPFSTLNFLDNDDLYKRYYPNDCLVTGYDIIPFWVNRMTFQGLEFTNKRPFKDCLIHGLIRDKEGRKMSKSLGNGVDPMDVIEEYGADSLRFFLTTNTSLGMDLRYDEEKVSSTWNFINKLWNASRYVFMSLEDANEQDLTLNDLTISDKWILSKLNKTIKQVTQNMEKYEYQNVGTELYSFIWNDFCDWYIELSKVNNNNTTKTVLRLVLLDILKMLHPFMPHVTEEIYLNVPFVKEKSIMLEEYPKYQEQYLFNEEETTLNKIIEDIVSIRNLKANNNITKDNLIKLEISSELRNIYFKQLKITEENLVDEIDKNYINYKSNFINITYYLEEETIDFDSIKEEIVKLENSINKRKNLLSNENYINKAPSNVVEIDKQKLKEELEKLSFLQEKLK